MTVQQARKVYTQPVLHVLGDVAKITEQDTKLKRRGSVDDWGIAGITDA
jgi:hypothetical protein